MLKYIQLQQVGPAGEEPLRLDFGSRLNILTGDNGLGKTFALDIAWWALTRTWPHQPAWPRKGSDIAPEIKYQVDSKTTIAKPVESEYDFSRQCWALPKGRKPMPGLVIYARVGGGFSVWDPARNYWRERDDEADDARARRSAFHFASENIWDGLRVDESAENGEKPSGKFTWLCNGLIRDWVTWQDRQSEEFSILKKVLERLSPSEDESIKPGKPVRVRIDDTQDIPTIEMPYGTVPVTLASAGMKRIVALAYLVVWAWSEHQKAAELRNEEPTDRFVLLFDEVETHLHPQWQRVFLPALLEVVRTIGGEAAVQQGNILPTTQIIASTHAPLVMASVETEFSESIDKVFTFELAAGDDNVKVVDVPWAKQGDAVNWLVSEAFGLRQARSKKAEEAIEAAEAFMRDDLDALPDRLSDKKAIHQELLRILSDHDHFWPRWIVRQQEVGK